MTHQPKLVELAERCEKATGPDRELEWAIIQAKHPGAEPHPSPGLFKFAGGNFRLDDFRYTASLDAAMTLKGDWLLDYIQETDEGYTTVGLYRRNRIVLSHDRATGVGKTPALALCAAALRAMEQRNA